MKGKITQSFNNYGRVIVVLYSGGFTIDLQILKQKSAEDLIDSFTPGKNCPVEISNFEEPTTYDFYPYYRRFIAPFTVKIYGRNYD